MASPSELSFDMKPLSHSMLLKSFVASGEHQQQPEPKQLEDFLACLEDERLKIEAFKRELPLCMQLLSNAVETSREKLHAVKSSSNQGTRPPVLEEFIPLKNQDAATDEEARMETSASKNMIDKSNWMVSAQLWSQTPNNKDKNISSNLTKQTEHLGLNMINPSNNMASCLQRGAFIPFIKDDKNEHHLLQEENKLFCPTSNNMISGGMIELEEVMRGGAADNNLTTSNTTHNNSNNNQPQRKARRCWSSDLHRKFVNALQMLGGSQVATPKQIRELMKVDGLTNDEVKSHLQKYRLHTRRPSPSPPLQPTPAAAAQLVVLGGIWVPPEYAAQHTGAVYSAGGPHHHQPVPAGPEYYGQHHRQQLFHIHQHQQMQMQMQMQQQQHAMHVFNNKKDMSSPDQSDVREDRSESIDEDGKSESGSWKGGEISVENGKERVKVGGEDDSVVTLKF